MNHISDGFRGLSLIVSLNADRLLVIAALCVAIAAGAYMAHP